MMDVLFGTYRCPDHEPESFGLREPIAETYLDYMLLPLLSADWVEGKAEAEQSIATEGNKNAELSV